MAQVAEAKTQPLPASYNRRAASHHRRAADYFSFE
jgi:hypothetical protein